MNIRRYVTSVVVSALALGLAVGPALAVSLPFTYQGQLKSEEAPFDGQASFAFQLYDKEVDGEPLATDEFSEISVVNGLFTVELLFEVEFDGRPLWLQIHVRVGDQEWVTLEPRQPITPAPYAIYAYHAPETGGECLWNDSGNDIFYNAGNVGIGTDNPSFPLHVTGTALAGIYSDTDFISGQGVQGRALANSGAGIGVHGETWGTSGRGVYGHATATSGEAVGVMGETSSPDGFGGYFLGRGYFSGNLGIGTENPSEKLQVAGTIHSVSGGFKFPDGTVQTTAGGGGGDSVWQQVGSEIYYDAGYVGVGTSNPDYELHVVNPVTTAIAGECQGEGTYGYLGDEYAGVRGYGHKGVVGDTDATNGRGVYGRAYSSTGTAVGVQGDANSPGGYGVMGYNNDDSGTGEAVGVYAVSNSPTGIAVKAFVQSPEGYGVYAFNEAASGSAVAVYGETAGPSGVAVKGSTASGVGVKGEASSSGGRGVFGQMTDCTGYGVGVEAYCCSPNAQALYAFNECDSGDCVAIRGESGSPDGFAGYFMGKGYFSENVGIGTTTPAYPLHVVNAGSIYPIAGENLAEGNSGYLGHEYAGVYGEGPSSGVEGCGSTYGVSGYSENCGVYGDGDEYGVHGLSSGVGVKGHGTGTYHPGVWALAEGAESSAVYAENTGGGIGLTAKGAAAAANLYGNVTIYEYGTTTKVIELGKGLDYAEGFDVSNDAPIAPGTVLVIDPAHPGQLAVSTEAYDCKVAGIVAGANGLGSGVRLGADEFDHDVALAGRVYCNVDATEHAIEPGDLLTTSATPGYAMKVTDREQAQGAILGKAMQPLNKGEKGQILVLVTLQ